MLYLEDSLIDPVADFVHGGKAVGRKDDISAGCGRRQW